MDRYHGVGIYCELNVDPDNQHELSLWKMENQSKWWYEKKEEKTF